MVANTCYSLDFGDSVLGFVPLERNHADRSVQTGCSRTTDCLDNDPATHTGQDPAASDVEANHIEAPVVNTAHHLDLDHLRLHSRDEAIAGDTVVVNAGHFAEAPVDDIDACLVTSRFTIEKQVTKRRNSASKQTRSRVKEEQFEHDQDRDRWAEAIICRDAQLGAKPKSIA